MSGSPFRLVSHQIAKRQAASARQIARTSVTRNSWRSRLRSNRSSFCDVPLTAAGAGALVLGQHEKVVSRRSKIRGLTFTPS